MNVYYFGGCSMNVHNLMEDLVIQNVGEMYAQVKEAKAAWLTCDCENCRLDTVSYVKSDSTKIYCFGKRCYSCFGNLEQ